MATRLSAEANVPHTVDIINEKGGSAPITVHDEADVLEVTHERPYGEMNFWGTYVAVGLGALACYGGFVMPATSLALIEADIGTRPRLDSSCVSALLINIAFRWHFVVRCLDCPLLDSVLVCRLRPCRTPL